MQGLLTLFSETTTYNLSRKGWKKKKKKKTRSSEAARRKSYPIRPMTSKLRHIDISATSSRRIDVSTTLFWRPTPAGMLLKKVKAQPHMTSY